MNKFIAKNYYKISLILVITSSFFLGLIKYKIIYILFVLIILLLLYLIHKHEFDEINSKFTSKINYYNSKEEFLTSKEEDEIYDEIYNTHFNIKK